MPLYSYTKDNLPQYDTFTITNKQPDTLMLAFNDPEKKITVSFF